MLVSSFYSVLRDKMPSWLLGPWGEKWVSVFASLFDSLQARAKAGTKAHFPTECDASFLPTLGWERGLERAPGEPGDDYRTRIHQAPTTYKWAGTDIGVLRGLATLGWTPSDWVLNILGWPVGWAPPANVWLVPAHAWGGSTPDGDSPTPNWARFWVVIDWYSRWGTAIVSDQDKAAAMAVVQKWRAARSPARGIVFITSDGGWEDIRGSHVTRGPDRTRGGRTEVVIP